MLVRERLTGLKPPSGAARVVELWRPVVEGKAGAELDKLGGVDPRPARLRPRRCTACSPRSTWPATRRPTRTRARNVRGREHAARATPTTPRARASSEESADAMEMEASEDSADELEEGAMEAADAPSAEFPDEADAGESEEAAENRPPHAGRRPARARLQGLHHQVRRDRQRRGPLRARGIAAAARLSRQAVAEPLQRRRAGSPTGCSGG